MLDAYRRGQSIPQIMTQGYLLHSEQKAVIAKDTQ